MCWLSSFSSTKPATVTARCGITQYRMADQRGLDGRDRKAGGYQKYRERDDEARKMPAQHDGEARADARQHRSRPPHRLMVGREIENDAEAVADREPRQEMRGSDLLGHPLAKFCGREKAEPRPGHARRSRRSADGPSGRPALEQITCSRPGYATVACGTWPGLWRTPHEAPPETFAQVSRRPTVRLNTSRSGVASLSGQK